MAEETKETNSAAAAKKSSKAKRPAKKKAAAKGAAKATSAKRAESRAMATERPAPVTPQKKTSQYVLTVDNQTGMTLKIERIDEDTGKRKELSKEEYGQAMAYAGLSSSPQLAGRQDVSASGGDAEALVQAYYRGMADYLNALTSSE